MSKHPFLPLRRRAVRLLWGAAVLSDIGTWVQLIVVGSLVAGDTGSAVQTGLVALATFAPQGLASPIGGLLADRFDRRRVFAGALLAQASFTTGLAIALAAGVRTPAVLTVFILMASAAGALGQPAYSAMQPDLVPADELMAMLSLGIYSWNLGRIVGPLLGALLAAAVGPAATVAFNAFTFVVVAVAVSMLRRPFLPPPDTEVDGSVVERLAGGWQTLRATPGAWFAVVLLVLVNLSVVPFMGLIPIYVSREFSTDTRLIGVVAALQGVGAIVGGVLVNLLAHHHSRSWIVERLVLLITVALVAYGLAPNVPVLLVAVTLLGACMASVFISISSVVQRDAPAASRGRVMSIWQASMGLTYGVGLLQMGVIGDTAGLRVAWLFGAVALLLGGAWVSLRIPNWHQVVDGEPAPEPSPTLAVA